MVKNGWFRWFFAIILVLTSQLLRFPKIFFRQMINNVFHRFWRDFHQCRLHSSTTIWYFGCKIWCLWMYVQLYIHTCNVIYTNQTKWAAIGLMDKRTNHEISHAGRWCNVNSKSRDKTNDSGYVCTRILQQVWYYLLLNIQKKNGFS